LKSEHTKDMVGDMTVHGGNEIVKQDPIALLLVLLLII